MARELRISIEGTLRVDDLMGLSIPKVAMVGRRAMMGMMQERGWSMIRRGLCRGDWAFRWELPEKVDSGLGAAHYGSERKDSQMQRAERIIAEELKSAKGREGDLLDSPKTHPVKANLAVRLRRETTLTCEWIARRLHMGARSTVSNLVYATRRTQGM